MSSSDSMSAKTSVEALPRSLVLSGLLVIAVGIGLVALLYFGPGSNPTLSPVRADILKSIADAILQLTVLGVVGVAVKSAFDRHQVRRTEAREDALRNNREMQEETERAQQAHNAVTELRKALLRRVLTANRVVRKAGILIPAHASAKTYGEQMRILIDAQLEFSDIRHEIDTIPTLFASTEDIKKHLDRMEGYLEGMTAEYRQSYQNIVAVEKTAKDRADVRAALDKLGECKDFMDAWQGSKLRTVYVNSYWGARDAMRRDILGGWPAPTAALS
jgi:hypothetical protein